MVVLGNALVFNIGFIEISRRDASVMIFPLVPRLNFFWSASRAFMY